MSVLGKDYNWSDYYDNGVHDVYDPFEEIENDSDDFDPFEEGYTDRSEGIDVNSGDFDPFEENIIDDSSTIQELSARIEQLESENRALKAEVESLREERLIGPQMKDLYHSGKSLRQIGRIFNCDHNTVKRKLVKMGVQIRK